MSESKSVEVCIFEPRDGKDVALIDMALQGSDVVYQIENRHYAAAAGHPAVGDARMRLLVRADQVEAARTLLAALLPS